MKILESKFAKDLLEEGKLPAVVIDKTSIFIMSGSMLAVGLILLLVYQITKS